MKTTQCLQCNSKIAMSWLLCAGPKTKYVCPNCGTTLEFKGNRNTIANIELAAFFLLLLTKDHIPFLQDLSDVSIFIVALAIGFSVLLLIPGQFKKSEIQKFING